MHLVHSIHSSQQSKVHPKMHSTVHFSAISNEHENNKTPEKPFLQGFAWRMCRPRVIIKLSKVLEKQGIFKTKGSAIPWDKMEFSGPIEQVDFKSLDGLALKGYWMKASTPSKTTVILGHGLIADSRMFLPLASKLREEGFNVFMFDYRAHGKSAGKISTLGQYEGQDLAAATYHVTQQHPIASQRIFYMGHSMGAATLMLTPKSLEHYPEALKFLTNRFSGIILDSPFDRISPTNFADLKRVVELEFKNPILRKLHQFIFEDLGIKVKNALLKYGLRFFGDPLGTIHTGPIFAKHPISKKPILLIHGTHDIITPFSHALTIREALKDNPNFQMLALENESHRNLSWTGLEDGEEYMVVNRGGSQYFDTIIAFLRQHTAS